MDGQRTMHKIFDFGGPLSFFENGPGKGTTRVWIVDPIFCKNPDCNCRDITLDVFVVDTETGKQISITQGPDDSSILVDGRPVESLMHCRFGATMNIDTGEVTAAGSSLDVSPDLMKSLSAKLTSETLEILKRRWRFAKSIGQDDWKNQDWTWWDPGEMISWGEVFPDEPDLIIQMPSKTCLISDIYCIKPRCSCTEIGLVVYEFIKKKTLDLGEIFYNVKHDRIERVVSRAASRDELIGIFEESKIQRPKLKKILATRFKKMRIIGPQIAQLSHRLDNPIRPAAQKVGRNDPCPCGSGRKYKKCCIEKRD